MPDKPSKLYKYQAFNVQNIENLKNQTLFFSHPRNFNDPFDCSIADIQIDAEGYLRLYNHFYERTSPEGKQQMEDLFKDERGGFTAKFYEETDLAIASIFNDPEVPMFYEQRFNKGISCLAEHKDNILMWGHYADGHRGFCLEFDRGHEPFNTAKQVRYDHVRPNFDVVKALIDDQAESFIDIIYSKHDGWSYEDEWRIIHNNADMAYIYDASSLTGIYFGSEMKFAHKEIISLILKGQNPDVLMYEGIRSETQFGIEFEQVDYTAYIDRTDT